jgi:hypothetical protein
MDIAKCLSPFPQLTKNIFSTADMKLMKAKKTTACHSKQGKEKKDQRELGYKKQLKQNKVNNNVISDNLKAVCIL